VTHGAVLLRRVVDAVGIEAIATAIGALQRAVARWVEGVEVPPPPAQAALEGCYNLPGWAWYQPAAGDAVVVEAPPEPPPAASAGSVSAADAESIDLLNAQLQRVACDIDALRGNTLGGVNYAEIARLEKLYTAIVEKRATVLGLLKSIEENRLARTETFRGFARKIVEALREHPEARLVVMRALGWEEDAKS
jgi:hypothetical protein